ncbi:unnamed protein product [Cylindrotheca closterium]|uniref:BCNT-C domain-containing protein n=1 Tax=Cylindrotheca closterium TaxID=2856 RepID=A0AAD2FET8_9STRA|nr:unnamed protein product [Cylindrotheca closterium]
MVQEEQASTDTSNAKRKATGNKVDDAFERLFGYSWGTTFALDDTNMTGMARNLVDIFGTTKTARILNVRGSIKRRRIEKQPIVNYKDIVLPETTKSVAMEDTVFAGQVVKAKASSASSKPKKKAGKIDNILDKLKGPNKMNTVEKTNNDWESFKESDKQLQEDLEKRAQGKDAFLVKQDFLNRVDTRTFELEKEERDRERAKRGTPG